MRTIILLLFANLIINGLFGQMIGFSTLLGPCVNGSYTLSGNLTYQNPPNTGQLIITNCAGQQLAFNPPFLGNTAYSFLEVPATGGPCSLNAYFTANTSFTISLNLTSVPNCPCDITSISVDLSACESSSNTFVLSGSVSFVFPPNSGTLTVSDCQGNVQVFNAPFVSPINYQFSNLFADATPNCTVTAAFSTFSNCIEVSPLFDYPEICNCAANAGTYQLSTIGQTSTLTDLCFQDVLQIIHNNDFTPPAPFSSSFNYDPSVGVLLYSCQPTIFQYNDVNDDPCLLGLVNAANDVWSFENVLADGSLVYAVPVTLYNEDQGIIFNPEFLTICFAMGEVYPIRYLPEVQTTVTTDCQAATLTATVFGGAPQVYGSSFIAQNLIPTSATFQNTTCNNNGAITISGLQNGDNYSFDIVDPNGCNITISGIYEGTNLVEFFYPNTSFCATDANPVPLINGAGGGFFSANNSGLSLNPVTGEINLLTSLPGNYVVSYQTPEPVCFSIATFGLSIQVMHVVTQNHNVCEVDLPVTFSGFTFFESGQEELLFNSSFGCDSMVIVSVTVQPTPVPLFDFSEVGGCTPLEVNFVSQNNPLNGTCEWNFGISDQNVLGCNMQTHIYETEGCFDVSLTVTNGFGCSATTTMPNLICAIATPIASFNASPSVLERWNALTQFINMTSNAQSYVWDFGDNSGTSNIATPSHQYPDESGIYLVTLKAFNENCVDSAQLFIRVEDNPIYYIPNAFTPDGEGINEIFQPIFFTGFDPNTYSLTIFNRWGELIFESNHYAKGWDGMYGDMPCPEGAYVYQISFKHADNDNVSLVRGHFSLLR